MNFPAQSDLETALEQVRHVPAETAVHTRWVVLTGAPSAGKSTVLDELARRGYTVRSEAARAYMQELLATGVSLDKIVQDKAKLVREILSRTREVVEVADPECPIVFDRSPTDVLAFAVVDGVDFRPLVRPCTQYRFAAALVFEQTPFPRPELTYHSVPEMHAVAAACRAIYGALHARMVNVPILSTDRCESIERRVSIVEEEVSSTLTLDL